VRDLHLRHTLTALARDASEVFSDLVDGGQEIPYEIGEAGDDFAFCHYQPLTARFVRDAGLHGQSIAVEEATLSAARTARLRARRSRRC